jgi:mono/diheme cytochrome c family protein
MKRILKWIVWTMLTLAVLAGGAYAWAYQKAMGLYETEWTVHRAAFPIPYPLSEDDLTALRHERIAAGASPSDPLAGVDLQALARERAIRRGEHLVKSRVGCNGCHGKDFGGAVLIDMALVGHWVAPNLTAGEGSVTRGFTATEWDHAVRHAVRHTGKSSSMPSGEFVNLTDHELSDIVSFIQAQPPVNRDLGPVRLGPVFAFMLARNPDSGLPAFVIDHARPHTVDPPAASTSPEFGSHIVQVCRGCHGPTLSGGKVAGDPNMPIVANLTPHETGLKDWTEADFFRALREGRRKDGSSINPAMPWKAYGQMTDTELKAVWAYLRTVPPVEKGHR